MAIEFHIRVENGTMKITVGGHGPGSGCRGPVVVGPIVLGDSSMPGQSGQGAGGPAGPSGNSGGGGPAGPSGNSGGGGPAGPSGNSGGNGPAGPSGNSGGGPASQSGFSGPVVIGPIVIGNWGQSSASSDPPDPQQISTCPPAGAAIGARATTFVMQPQKETDWCWAAVAVSINGFLDPNPLAEVATWTQASLATKLLEQVLQWNPPVNCDMDPNQQCDQPMGLDVALTITGNLRPDGAKFSSYLDFASIQCWIDAQLPVGVRVVWLRGGAHFIALSGYLVFRSGEQKVIVQDPLYGPSVQDYSSLQGQYIYQGTWNDTYLVTQ
jgi:Papain-like cysteine protease AvrRpt2